MIDLEAQYQNETGKPEMVVDQNGQYSVHYVEWLENKLIGKKDITKGRKTIEKKAEEYIYYLEDKVKLSNYSPEALKEFSFVADCAGYSEGSEK